MKVHTVVVTLRRRVRRIVFFTLLVLTPVVLAFDGGPVERWAKAVGGLDRVATIKSIYREGMIDYAGMQISVKLWHTADGKYRKEEQGESFSLVETFDGATGMVKVGDQSPRKMTSEEMQLATSRRFANANAMFFAFFPERRKGTVSVEDSNTIVLKPEGGVEWRVVLDPQTSLPNTMVHKEGEQTITVEFVSFETVDGVKLQKEMHRSAGGPQKAVIRFSKTVINSPLEATHFSIPN